MADATHRMSAFVTRARLAWTYLREFKGRLFASVALILGASAFELAGVALVIPLLEQLGTAPGESGVSRAARSMVRAVGLEGNLPGLLMLFAVFTIAKFCLTETAGYSGRMLAAWIRYRMRQRIFDNLMDLPMQFYYTRRVGDVISTTDTSTTEAAALAENGIRLINVIVFAAVYIGVQLMLSVWMTVAVLLFTALSYVFVSPRFAVSFSQGQHAKRLFDAVVSFLQDRLSGIKTIKVFGNEDLHRAELDRIGVELRELAGSTQKNKIVAHAFGEPFMTVAIIGILVFAVRTLNLGVVELVAFFYTYGLLIPRVKSITSEALTIVEKLPHLERVDELAERRTKTYLADGAEPFPGLQAPIEIEHVTFSYGPGAPPVLSDVTISIPLKQTTALVGPSGVGKTTLVDLVLRLHDPASGRILVNGTDLRNYAQRSWHSRLAVVEQEPFLFHDSVLSNIRYGKPAATLDEVRAAATLAHAADFIEALPAGYDTMVGQRGMALSGGQRQRIALARALIREPDVLVLDEATSALDSESERFIQEAIDQLRSQCTMIVIAHRLSTIARADNIVVLEAGRIVETGTHDDLLGREGLYRRYYQLQSGTDQAMADAPPTR